MRESKQYRCVNCGAPAAALFKAYGPSVLKLTKCDQCKEVVDKYIEYDPVIVMIDIVLMSKEAQRHVLYNTEFKSYWKLFIILVMLETYGVWRNDSLFNITINSVCGFNNNSTMNTTFSFPVRIPAPESWKNSCWAWNPEERVDETDLFIWEKDYYIQFMSTFAGIVVFILLVNSLMRIFKLFFALNDVSVVGAVRGFSLAHAAGVGALPALVWGAESARDTHHALVLAYSLAMYTGVFTVLYDCPAPLTLVSMIAASCAKYSTSFHVTPYLRHFIS